MQESDNKRILDFLTGNETVKDFENWLYYDKKLESRIGSKFFFDLITIDYRLAKKNINDIIMDLVTKYLKNEDLKNFKYYKILLESGWKSGRKTKVALIKSDNSLERKNGFEIIKEFGGLELISPYKTSYYTQRNVKFRTSIDEIIDGVDYVINKKLVCFATAHNNDLRLYVDDMNNFYELDGIANIELYKYKDMDFIKMMQTVLGIEKEVNICLVGRKNQSFPNKKHKTITIPFTSYIQELIEKLKSIL